MMFEIGFGVLILGALLGLIGGIMFLVNGFKASPWWGLGILFFGPLVGLFFFFTNFKKAWSPALMHILGTIMVPASVFLAPQDPEFNNKMVNYFPFMEGQEIDTELIPSFGEVVEIAKQVKIEDLQAARLDAGADAAGEGEEGGKEGGLRIPVLSFDPSEPLDPEHVEMRVVPGGDASASSESAGPAINIEPPSVSLNRQLVGKPESAVTETLGKPIGMGSKKGRRYWMYSDCMVSFDKNRLVKAVEFDIQN